MTKIVIFAELSMKFVALSETPCVSKVILNVATPCRIICFHFDNKVCLVGYSEVEREFYHCLSAHSRCIQ